MHDIRAIRESPEAFDAALGRRGVAPVAEQILGLDERRRAVTTRVQEGLARRNEASKAIGQAMGKGDSATADALKAEVAELKASLPALEDEDRAIGAELDALLAGLANIPADDVPEGADENDNVEVSRWGTRHEFAFTPLEHADLGPALGLDFETGAKMSGARFTFLRGQIARLERALGQFMLDYQTDKRGYSECVVPLLVRDEAVYGTGQLPKFAADLFQTSRGGGKDNFISARMDDLTDGDYSSIRESLEAAKKAHDEWEAGRLWLIPTAEVSLTNSVAGDIIEDLSTPIRLTSLTPCFRSEAGAAGRDTRGYIRQHQFSKTELVTICRPEDAAAEHDHMVASAEGVLEALGLPYRKVLLCTGDMGATAKKTFDLEVWLPGQGAYREISSISWCGDYQARRMNTRFRPAPKKTEFVHTLNGSGLAVGRTLVAVLENYQQEDGSVIVPEALRGYMGGLEKLVPAG